MSAQTKPFERETNGALPAMIGPGNGRFFKASNEAYRLIERYAALVISENADISVTISKQELLNLVSQSVASLIESLDDAKAMHLEDREIVNEIDERLAEKVDTSFAARDYYYGCAFLHGDAIPKSLAIGPVSFESRPDWLCRMESEQGLSKISARRIKATWAGNKPRKRKNANQAAIERSLLDAVGRMDFVCSVKTGKQSAKASAPKALLAAQLALSSVSLMWFRPSRALNDMALERDGLFHHRMHAVSSGVGNFGASYSVMGSRQGAYADENWKSTWVEYGPLYQPVGDALRLYTHPDSETERPKILKAIFMALWWFHEACREQSDLMAVAKFASAMDAASGGGRAPGITRLIEHRLGRRPDEPWLTTGDTPKALINEIYEFVRNNVLHGSIKDFDRDYSDTCARAEFITRQCLLASLDWVNDNPEIKDMRKIRNM